MIQLRNTYFVGKKALSSDDLKYFYVDIGIPNIGIPNKGTTIDVQLKLVPIGMTPNSCKGNFCYEVSQGAPGLYGFSDSLLKKLSNKSLQALKIKSLKTLNLMTLDG